MQYIKKYFVFLYQNTRVNVISVKISSGQINLLEQIPPPPKKKMQYNI